MRRVDGFTLVAVMLILLLFVWPVRSTWNTAVSPRATATPAHASSTIAAIEKELLRQLSDRSDRDLQMELNDLRTKFELPMVVGSPDQPPLIVTGSLAHEQSLILWQDGKRWCSQRTTDLGVEPLILRDQVQSGGRELVIHATMPGSGGFGRLVVLLYSEDRWQTAVDTEWISHLSPCILDDDHVLLTGRSIDPDMPLAWTSLAELPISHQWLWKRVNQRYQLVAERDIPGLRLALNVFFGALCARSSAWLHEYATPAAIESARRLKLDDPKIGLEVARFQLNVLRVIDQVEQRHWARLPPHLNGPAPQPEKRTVLIELAGASYQVLNVTVVRKAERWIVTEIDWGG